MAAERDSSPASEDDAGRTPIWLLPTLFGLFVLILVLPAPTGMPPAAHRLVAVAVLMAGLWMTHAIPLAATSLIPLALFPLLGIQSAKDTSKAFVEDSLFLYIGGMIIALGIERWQLHRRMALHIVSLVGVSPKRMVLGFAIATFGLSMWISNTATTMLMLPIGLAMLKILDEGDVGSASLRSKQVAVPLLLMLAYASTLGGMATLVGSPTNNQAIGIYRTQLPDAPPVYFAEWLLSCGPIALFYLAVVWLVLTRGLPKKSDQDDQLLLALKERLRSLGPVSAPEWRMTIIFGLTAVLWITREPLTINGVTVWAGWLGYYRSAFMWLSDATILPPAFAAKDPITDATIAMLMASLLFLLPSGERDGNKRAIPLMDWKTANRLPWDMVLLFGGGFALASGFESTQLAKWLGKALEPALQGLPAWQVVAVVCLILILLTELTSNVATVSAVLPTLLAMAEPLNLDPRMLFVPATLAASAGFMMPVGTPPNAIVFSTGRIPSGEMARRGLILNLLGVPILTIGTYLLIRPIMGIR
jgi:sodium-dependent dicarboxylate transporter 2/3/5